MLMTTGSSVTPGVRAGVRAVTSESPALTTSAVSATLPTPSSHKKAVLVLGKERFALCICVFSFLLKRKSFVHFLASLFFLFSFFEIKKL